MTIRVTSIEVLQLREQAGQCLVRVTTDADITGLGEAGAPAQQVRSSLTAIRPLLVGESPLERDRLFRAMSGQTHPNRSHMPTVAGVDIALWDISGRALGLPVSQLLGGSVRSRVPLYATNNPTGDHGDPAVWQEWASNFHETFAGWKTAKIGFDSLVFGVAGREFAMRSPMPTPREFRSVRLCLQAAREALGEGVDLIVHCHNEWDLPGALAIAEAAASVEPLWLEDPLPFAYSDSWRRLADRSPVRIATGEKLDGADEFLPFFAHGGLHVAHPDLAFAGGFSGCRRIAELADLYRIPLAVHCVGSIVHSAATAHFCAATPNIVLSETRIGHPDHPTQQVGADQLPIVDGSMVVPTAPGLGIELTDEMLEGVTAPGERWSE